MKHVLGNAYIWIFFRKIFDLMFGHYRKRMRMMQEWGIDNTFSVLDIGCGTGEYSKITNAEYLGIDMNCRYIAQARKKYGNEKKKFECIRLQEADFPPRRFDISVLIDLTHHISREENRQLFSILSKITDKYLIVADAVKQSRKNFVGRWMTYLDQGTNIRRREEELVLVSEYFDIIDVRDTKLVFTEGIMLIAKPK